MLKGKKKEQPQSAALYKLINKYSIFNRKYSI